MSKSIPIGVTILAVETGSIIKAWMIYKGITQVELARRLNCKQPNISCVIASKKNKKATKVKLAKALGITVEQLNYNPSKPKFFI
jgi:plasmid maintenance system antidote protein VapI